MLFFFCINNRTKGKLFNMTFNGIENLPTIHSCIKLYKISERPAATTDNDDIPETKHIKENEIEPR